MIGVSLSGEVEPKGLSVAVSLNLDCTLELSEEDDSKSTLDLEAMSNKSLLCCITEISRFN